MQIDIRGIRLSFEDTGKGPPLLLVHGYPLSRDVWRAQIDELRSTYRVIAPDLCGFGSSESRSGPVTMEEFARDLAEFSDRIHAGAVTLAGHSMGGYIALAFARHFPEKLSRLVLVATRAGADTQAVAAARRASAGKVLAEGVQSTIETMAPKMLAAKNRSPQMLARVCALMGKASPQGVAGALLGMAQRIDATELLPKISVPTLVITGADDDLIAPQESIAMAGAIPGAQLEILPGAGHLLFVEKPGEFNAALKAWMQATEAKA